MSRKNKQKLAYLAKQAATRSLAKTIAGDQVLTAIFTMTGDGRVKLDWKMGNFPVQALEASVELFNSEMARFLASKGIAPRRLGMTPEALAMIEDVTKRVGVSARLPELPTNAQRAASIIDALAAEAGPLPLGPAPAPAQNSEPPLAPGPNSTEGLYVGEILPTPESSADT